jgi:glyoxylase-like metal-dependent hydrolase (beta-lactamase superfamily II)
LQCSTSVALERVAGIQVSSCAVGVAAQGAAARRLSWAGVEALWREDEPVQVWTRDLGDDVYALDTQMGGYAGITAGYLLRTTRPCLVETGTARSAPVVRDALASLGVGAGDLATVVVTHIHLDHAGGVGDIARMYPNAQVVVHERGARHLVDPAKLVASARRVFGAVMDEMFGDLLPTEAARVRALDDGDEVDLGGGRALTAYHSPGHAQHHVGLLDSSSGDLYVGDAAGIYVPEKDLLQPSTPPPDFDLDTALSSLQRFRDLRPARLLFSHFGPVDTVDATLEQSGEELRLWVELVRETRASALDLEHAVAMVRERTAERYAAVRDDPVVAEKFERLNSTETNINGINRWLDSLEASD